VPLTAPSGSQVTLFSNTTIVPVNGTAEITATVIESGGTLVQNGTLVTFTTTIGTIDPAEARTRDGKVTVRLVAGNRSGRAVVRAFSGGTASGDLTLDVGGAAAGRIALSANPSNVPITGGTSTLTAIVFDVDGNPLPGAPVSFTTNAGSIAQSVVVTNALGEAQTTITTNRETTVTARAGGAGATGGENGAGAATAVEATVTITASALPTAGVSTSTTNPTVGQPVVFTITAGATSPAAVRSVVVDFGDGTSQNLGAVATNTSVSHIYRRPGAYTVTVTVEDTNGARSSASSVIVVQEAAPILVSLVVSPQSTTPGAVVTFTARVDQNPNNVPVQSVSFAFGDGNGRPAQASLTTSHIYGVTGNFLATVTVRFTNGEQATGTAAVVVR
jgi:adhesin/invasin